MGAGLVPPHANAEGMTLHLTETNSHNAPGAYAVVVLDGASGRQTGERLEVLGDVSLLHPPPL